MSPDSAITDRDVDVLDRSTDPNEGQVAQVDRRARPEFRVEPDQDWLDDAEKQIQDIAGLPNGWDGEDAAAPDRDMLIGGLSLLECLHQVPGIPKPHINPTREGGVQFEWEAGSRYFEIELVAREAASYFYQDQAAGVEDDGEIFVDEPLYDLVRYIEQVAVAEGIDA